MVIVWNRGQWMIPLLLILLGIGTVRADKLALQPLFGERAFEQPVLMLQAPNDDRHWYVVERRGKIHRLRADGKGYRLFLDLGGQIESGPQEAGLLGMAFHPGFATSGQIFLSYTRAGSPLTSVLARFRVHDGVVDRSGGEVLLEVAQPYTNHNGGHIAFGPDGALYFGLGDGGSAGDPKGNGQDADTLLGALLRLDVDGGKPYAIPSDNPFARGGGRPEIYAWGLRNPWRWSFDRQSGALWVGDVGQDRWEEVDLVHRGDNLGWNGWEGNHCYRRGKCKREGVVMPVAEYSHADGCSITGGYVYRGKELPTLKGRYIYGDFCRGTIWSLDGSGRGGSPQVALQSGKQISSFAEGNNAELYLLDFTSGLIFQLTAEM